MKQKFLPKLLLVVILLLCSPSLWAYDFTAKNDDGVTIYYSIVSSSKRTCEVAYPGPFATYSGSVVIPQTVKRSNNGYTYTVVGIGERAFYYCSALINIETPSTITYIDDYAFYECSSLTSVNIPNSVTSIGEWAFFGCTGLTSIDIPNSVTTIGGGAFSSCTGLTSVDIPNSVTTIGSRVFYYCLGLTSLTLGNSVTSIDYWAFLHIPEHIEPVIR